MRMNKDTGILYQPSMVQALLAGKKRQTRRIVHKIDGFGPVTDLRESSPGVWQFQDGQPGVRTMIATDLIQLCPFGQPGDRLFVREAHYQWGRWIADGTTTAGKPRMSFVGDSDKIVFVPPAVVQKVRQAVQPGWWRRNSLFMPKAATRLWLTIKCVRLERLTNISETDAYSEGANCAANGDEAYRSGFRQIWTKINGVQSWNINPAVWVIEFEVKPLQDGK